MPSVTQMSVMVVNDDPAFFETVKQGFESAGNGYEVFNAISGARALGLATAKLPAAVVVDGDMVGVDGCELTQQLKALPELASAPVVILSAVPNEGSALKARQAGAAAYMLLSDDPRQVVDKVSLLLGEGATAPAPGPSAAPAQEPPAEVPVAAEAGLGLPEPIETPSDGYGIPEPVAPSTKPPGYAGPSAAPLPGYSGPAAAPSPAPTAPDAGVGKPGGRETPHIDDLLWIMINRGGSDLHLTVGSPPGVRLRGEIVPIEDQPVLMPKDTMAMILNLLSEEQRRRFETELELDFAYSIPGVSRFRANVFQQRNSMGAVFRVIPLNIPTMEQLSLPKVCKYLSERPRGLVLVTGPTGSGKSRKP